MKNKNLVSMERILNNRDMRHKIVLTFDYEDIHQNMSLLKMLSSKGYKVATTNIPLKTKLTSTSFDLFDYVFIPLELYNANPVHHKVWSVKIATFIFDDEIGSKVIENR